MSNEEFQRLREELMRKQEFEHQNTSQQAPLPKNSQESPYPGKANDSFDPFQEEINQIINEQFSSTNEVASGMAVMNPDMIPNLQESNPFEDKLELITPDLGFEVPILDTMRTEDPVLDPHEPEPKGEPIGKLSDISFVKLKEEIDQLLLGLYDTHREQSSELYNEKSLLEKGLDELYETPIGRYFYEIYQVAAVYNGIINKDAIKAVNTLLPILWKAELSQDYLIPEAWYNTNFGYLCRYIKLGSINQNFDPIDVVAAANMLKETEEQVLSRIRELGGVKVSNNLYIFSRQKVEDYIREKGGTEKIREMEEGLKNINQYLSKVSCISRSLETVSNQIQMVQNALQSETLGKDPERINSLIQQNIQRASYEYSKLQLMAAELPNTPETFVLDQILEPIAKLGGQPITREQYLASIEESLTLIKKQLNRTINLKDFLIQKLGELTVELTTLKLNLDI